MSEPKYKIGDEVADCVDKNPGKVVGVFVRYRVEWPNRNTAMYDAEELDPYVRPLAVGDRVRNNGFDRPHTGTIIGVRDSKLGVWDETLQHFGGWDAKYCERIPTEAGQ